MWRRYGRITGTLATALVLALAVSLGQAGVNRQAGNSALAPTAAHAVCNGVSCGGNYCYNTSCDYKDPVVYYCVNDQQIIDSFNTYQYNGKLIGTTHLLWSNACAANWSEIYQDTIRSALIESQDNENDYTYLDFYGTFARSLMLGGLNNFVRGCSQQRQDNGVWTPFRCTNFH